MMEIINEIGRVFLARISAKEIWVDFLVVVFFFAVAFTLLSFMGAGE